MKRIVFSGGVGGARFLSGLSRVVEPKDITVISNVGDDSVFYGLYICPDIDIVLYTLSDRIDKTKGWGLSGDTFHLLEALKQLGHEGWFNLGDQDLATHLHRTMRLQQGWTLSQVTEELTRKNHLELTVLPVTDQRLETRFETDLGELSFQEYMVKHRWQTDVQAVQFLGAQATRPAPGVLEAIAEADQILLAPSNPYISIGAILAVPGIREALQQATCPVVAISPIVGGEAIKGPAARLMKNFGQTVSSVGVAKCYADLIDTLVIDCLDADLAPEVEALGIHCVVTDTMMTTTKHKEALGRFVVENCQ